jgi:hypothetical protein
MPGAVTGPELFQNNFYYTWLNWRGERKRERYCDWMMMMMMRMTMTMMMIIINIILLI